MKSSKITACVLGVGTEEVGLTNRFIYELPEEVTNEIQDVLNKYYVSPGDMEKYLVKKLSYNYK